MLRTRSPLSLARPFDLHVLGTPPAFILSQDQTLRQLTPTCVGQQAHTCACLGSLHHVNPRIHMPASCAWLVFSHSSVVKVRPPGSPQRDKKPLAFSLPASADTFRTAHAVLSLCLADCLLGLLVGSEAATRRLSAYSVVRNSIARHSSDASPNFPPVFKSIIRQNFVYTGARKGIHLRL